MSRSRVISVALCTSIALFLISLASEVFTGKCVSVTDGDSIGVLRDGREVKIRLDGIDCPEHGQDFASKAKKFTSQLVFNRQVEVKQKTVDKYGRVVARVVVDGRDVSLELVKAGLAWHYKQYSDDSVLATAELMAREQEEGIWALQNPIPPWDYRHGTVSPASPVESLSSPQQAAETHTVYVTKTGTKFHRDGCQYLKKSKFPMHRNEAIDKGYMPCSVCRP